MTFDELEKSVELATPLELYLFTASSRTYAYCNGENDYTFDGVVYKAVPIQRDRITSSGTLDRTNLLVTIADTTEIATLLRSYPVSSVITLVIRQGHHELSTDFLVAWSGRVLSAKGKNNGTREISCQPASTALRRNGLRRNWQYPCPHALYGPQCRASQPAASISVQSLSANKTTAFLYVGQLETRAPLDRWPGGLVSWTNADGSSEVRTILRVTNLPDGATALLLGGPASFVPGAQLYISLGCDRTYTGDCRNLHVPVDEAPYGGGNVHNFGGQPFIPTNNPVGLSRNY